MGNQGLQGGWALNDSGQVDFPHSLKSQFALMKSAGAAWVRLDFRLGRYYTDWTTPGADGTTALQKYDIVVKAAQDQDLQILGLVSHQSWRGSQADWCANNVENNPNTAETNGDITENNPTPVEADGNDTENNPDTVNNDDTVAANGDDTENNSAPIAANGDNEYVTNFAQNAALVLIQHFADSINTWEIWNEPNAFTSSPSPGVFTGGTFMYPSNFAWLLRRTYECIQTAELFDTIVVSGGLFGHNITVDSPADTYLTDTYTQGITNAGWDDFSASYGTYPLDMIGQHIYIDQGGTTTATHLQVFLDAIRNAYITFEGEFTNKQTVITEIGWTTAHVSPEVQAGNLQISFQTFQQTPYVNRAFWFNVQDVPEGNLLYGLQTGGSNADHFTGSPKTAFAAHQTFAVY